MSLHFDPSFDWLWVLVAGQQAPKVDVAATRALAQHWLDSGRTLQELADGVAQLVGSVEHAIGGRAGRAFREQVTRVVGQVPRIALIAGAQSSSLLDLALNVEHSVYAMMVEIAFFAASILWALSSPFTAPLVPSFITSARIAVQQISMRLHWAIRLIGEAVEGGVEEVVQDAIAQLSQVAEGNRHRWDGTSSLISFVAGGAAEGLAGAMHLGAGRWKPRVEDTAAFHGAAEAVADVVVGAGAAGVLGGSLNDLWAGAVGGAFSGAAAKKAHDAGDAIDRLVNGDAVKVPVPGAIGGVGGAPANGPVADEGAPGSVAERNLSATDGAGTWAGGGAARGAVPPGREGGTSAGGGVHADGGARASGGGRPGAVTGPGSGPARNGGADVPLGGRVAPVRGGVPAAVEVPRDVPAGGPPAVPGTGNGPQAGPASGSSSAESSSAVVAPATGSPSAVMAPMAGSSAAVVRPAAGSSPAVVPLMAGPSAGVVAPATGSSPAVVPAAGSSPAVVPLAAESSAKDVPFTPQTSPAVRDEVRTAPITGGQDAPLGAQPRAEHGLTASPPSGQPAADSSATHPAAVNDPQSAPSAQQTSDDRPSGRDGVAVGADPSRQYSDESRPGDDHRVDAGQVSANETPPVEAGGTSTASGGRVTAALPPSTEVPQAPGQAPDAVSQAPDAVSQVVRAQTPVAPEQATDIAHRSVVSTLEQPAVNGRRLLVELHRLMEVPGAQDRSYQLAQALSAAHEDGRLPGADYERALQVMGRVTTFLADPAAEMPLGSIAVGPDADPAELPSVRELVREVDARVQRQDFEGAVTLLDGLGRDPQTVRVVEDAYWDEFREDLGTELRRLRPDESAYVDHLLGDVITDPVSREQADAWFAQLRELTFDDHLFGERRLPHDYADDGCTYRAHRMAVALQQRGADPRKVVIGGPGLGTAEVEWDFHIAVAVAVVTPNSREWVVFDPSVNAERPLSIDDWARAAGADRVRRYQGTAEAVQQQLMDDQRNFPARWDDGYPVDVPVLVLTDSHVYGFPDLVGPYDTSWAHADAESRAAIVEMREFYALAAERRVDRALADIAARVDLETASGAGVSIDLVHDALSALAEREPVGVSGLFDREPEPLRRLLHLLPDHAGAIEDAVTPGGALDAGAQPERTGVVQRGRIRALPGHDAVERSAFEVRRFATGDGPVTEVTVRVALDPEGRHDEATREALLRSAQAGVDRYFNSGRDGGPLRRPDGEPLWFRLLPADGTSAVHHVVTMDPGRLVDQTNWHPGQSQEHSAHEFGHMLGLVDETTNQGGGLDVSGTLMGRWSPDAVPAGGLRMPRRFTDVLDLFIGDVPLDDFATVFPDRPVAGLPRHTVVPAAPRPESEGEDAGAELRSALPEQGGHTAAPHPLVPSSSVLSSVAEVDRLPQQWRQLPPERVASLRTLAALTVNQFAVPGSRFQLAYDEVVELVAYRLYQLEEGLPPGQPVRALAEQLAREAGLKPALRGGASRPRRGTSLLSPAEVHRAPGGPGSPAGPGRRRSVRHRRGASLSTTGSWVTAAEEARAWRAQVDQPQVDGEPDFAHLRSALRDQLRELGEDSAELGRWVDVTFSDAKLKQLDRSLEGIREVWEDFEVEVHALGIGAPHHHAVSTTADLTRSETVRQVEDVTSAEVVSTPVNPVQGSVPAGPVTVSFSVQGVLGTASERRTSTTATTRETVEITQAGARVTRTSHDVHHRLRIQPPKRHLHRERPEPVEWKQSVTMTLSWPQFGSAPSEQSDPPPPESPLTASPALSYPDLAATPDALARARSHADFERARDALEHVRFVGIDTVFSAVKSALRLSGSHQEITRLERWLDDLGPKQGKRLVTGEQVEETFGFPGHKPVKIVVRQGKALEGQSSATGLAQTAARSLGRTVAAGHRHSVVAAGTHEAGFELGVNAGEELAGLVGVKIGAGVSCSRVNQNLSERVSQVRHELTERIKGDFVDDTISFPFLVVMAEEGKRYRLATLSSDDAHRSFGFLRREDKPLVALHVEAAAVLLFSPVDSDSGNNVGARDEPAPAGTVRAAGARDRSGLSADEVAGYARSRWKLSDVSREAVISRVVRRLYADGVVSGAQDARDVQRSLRDALVDDPRALFGGDPKRISLPGAEKDLFLGGVVAPGGGEYVKKASTKELQGFVATSETTKLTAERTRSKGFKVAVEGDAGPVELGGTAGVTRSEQRRGQISETMEEERAWTGEDVPVHLYRHPAEIEVRTGTDWSDLDPPMTWSERPDPAADAELRTGIAAELEIAVAQRPGRAVDAGPVEPGTESDWVDAGTRPGGAAEFERAADLPKRFEVDSMAAITRLGAETAGLLAVPEPEGSRARAQELAKRRLVGARPAQLGSSGEDDAQDVSRRALEQWVSWQSRQGRLGLAEGPGDELRLENYNGDSGFAPLELGSRRITGTATLTSTYGNARIIGVDEAHEFTRSNATHTTVESHRQRRTGPNAGLTAKVKLGEVATAEAKAAASYLRGPETTETTTVDARTKVAWVERGYLVEFDARHRLTTSARHTWTGPFGDQHDGPVAGGDRRKYVPRAVTLWIPASEVPRIGELSRHDLDHVLLPDDLRAYEAARNADAVTPPPTSTSEAGIELGMPEPLRPDLALRMVRDLRDLLRDYEQTITDPKVRKQFAGLHDEMVQAFGRRLELGGDQVLANVLNGGSPIFGERLGESGKLEQLVVVSAQRVDGADLGVEEAFLVDSEVTTTRRSSGGERSEWTGSAGVALPPSIPKWIGSVVTSGLVNPAVELAAAARRGQDDRVLSRTTIGYRWSGQARRHGHGMRVTVQVRPWARSGVYRRHLPGLRQTPVRDMQVLPGFTLESAVQTPVPSVLDLARTPLETIDIPLSELTHGTGLPVDATINATPFHAEGLHARLAELLPELNAGRANGLLVSTTATQLAARFVAGLSPDGYQVDVGSRTVSTAKITFDLGRRQLFGPIPGASLRKTTAEGTGPVVTTEEDVTGKAALLAGPIAENLIGTGEVERTLAASRYASREAEPVPAEVRQDSAYLVLAELRPTLTLGYRDGRTSSAVATGQNGVDGVDGVDGEVWLQVDLAGARALGFTPPGAGTGQSAPPAGQISPATSRPQPDADPRHRTRLTSAYRNATRGRARLSLSETDLADWAGEVVALSSGAVEQHDLADGTAELLRNLDDALGTVSGTALRDQVRAVLNDAVLAATVVPVRAGGARSGDHRAVRPLSPDRLVHLLTDVARHLEQGHNPFTTEGSLLHGISYPVGAPVQSRLAVLATVNLTGPARAKVLGDPLFTALLGNPDALAESLFASAGHEPRHFQTTGGPAAVNIAVRDRALTIVSMLHAGDAVVSAMAAALPATSVDFRTHRDRPLGRVQGSRVRDRIAFAREEFAGIRTRAGELAAAADQHPAAWRELTDRWSRTMQKLAATDLTGPRLPVLTPTAAPGRPHVSGLGAALKLVDLPVRRRQQPELAGYLAALGAVLAPEPGGTAFGGGFAAAAGERMVPVSTKLTTARSQYGFWSWLAAGPGQVLHGGSSAVHIRAVRLDGRNLVALGDPRRAEQRLHALPEFGDLAHRHGWSAPESVFAGDAAFHRHERLSVDLPAASAVRVDAGVFVGADPDGPLSTAARYLPAEDDVVALVLDRGVALGADDVRRVLRAAGWNGDEAVRLFTAHDDVNPGIDAADLAARLGVVVTRPTADGWRWYWPDGKQRAGTCALEVPEEVAERFGLPAPQDAAVPVQQPRR
ncbi:protein-glutamine glutaminase family protein [Lentzea sp. NPDC042327]|uniref:protein-glutamine glutaminase family protein n=1 Tax=Lentzea sp. NPDC042327 TaxID=3154801 RepID=UPI0033E73988